MVMGRVGAQPGDQYTRNCTQKASGGKEQVINEERIAAQFRSTWSRLLSLYTAGPAFAEKDGYSRLSNRPFAGLKSHSAHFHPLLIRKHPLLRRAALLALYSRGSVLTTLPCAPRSVDSTDQLVAGDGKQS